MRLIFYLHTVRERNAPPSLRHDEKDVEQIALEWTEGPRVLTVSEFTEALRALVDREFGLLWISGEISGTKLASSGHYYFTLKDQEGKARRLDEFLGKGKVALVFYRSADW